LTPDEPLLRSMAQIGSHLARVVERIRNQEQLSHQATHDPLTGLPNRVLIVEHLTQSLAELERRPGLRHAVLFIDLDGFKQVNDTIGHAAGDQVLQEVANRLQTLRRKSDILGRLSGDEFVLVCQDLPVAWHADVVCQRIFSRFADDFLIGDEQFRLSASIGIAFCSPDERLTAGEAITRADAAMYRAKKQSGTSYVVYDEDLERSIKRRLSLEGELRRAVEKGELFLDYQPEVDLRDGRIAGVEALLRWRRPDGVLPPADFIPLAEETGIIVPIGGWVIEEACRQTAAWQRLFGERAPWMSVNLSVRQLADPATLEMAKATLAAHPDVAGNLFFEVTESVLLEDAESGLKVLGELKQLGTEIAIDDFGTGYASLSYLRRFPASAVKIDQSFVHDLDGNDAALAIVSSVVNLAHALGLQAVAEGVETRAQLEILRQIGCDLVQGFYLARPQPAEEIGKLLAAGSLIRT
jgi:diguanylate cyclase (GGDEF)-like protein